LISIASLVVIALVIVFYMKPWSKAESTIDNDPTTTTNTEKTYSIAVLPFWNDSPDPDNAYFCYGMEEEIRIQLLKISDLLIESRQSVEKFRENPEKDVISIGRDFWM